jgi:S-adenosylmethionine-diacylglycerol 3-amino-3-carboxypropyl transferase
LFGEAATANRVQEFSQHFFKQTLKAFDITHCGENPYLAQVLLGCYMNQVYPRWLNQEVENIKTALTYRCQPMIEALKTLESKVDFVHLSNILDWLTVAEAEDTLNKAYEALNEGGCVIVRQLNSSVDIPHLNTSFKWDLESSQVLHQKDRSYFYRHLYVGYKE